MNVEYVFDTELWVTRPAWPATGSFQCEMARFDAVRKPMLRRKGSVPYAVVRGYVKVDGIRFIITGVDVTDGDDTVELFVSPVGRLSLDEFEVRLGELVGPSGAWAVDASQSG